MVLKAKSDITVKPLRNVSKFSSWVLPSLDGGNLPGHKQPVEEVEEPPKPTEAELAKKKSDELNAIKEAAFKEGFNSGHSAGLAAAKNEIEQQLATYKKLINELSEPLKSCAEKTQNELLQLAFAIARQIVRRELRQDPTQLIAIIREAVRLLPIGSQKIEISLHPEDAHLIKNTLSIEPGAEQTRWKFNEDPAIERGSCLVGTKNSKIDASIDKQVAILFNRVAGGLRAGEADKEVQSIELNESLEKSTEAEENPTINNATEKNVTEIKYVDESSKLDSKDQIDTIIIEKGKPEAPTDENE